MRNSERSTFKACPFRWWLTYDMLLKSSYEKPALRFGTLVHMALADWYIPGVKRGVHPATGFEKHYAKDLETAEKMGFRDDDGTWVEAGELGVAMLNHYVDVYGNDDEWEVIATELPFQTLVPRSHCEVCGQPIIKEGNLWMCDPQCPNDGTGQMPGWFLYAGVIDGCWRNRRKKEVWIPDHKTTSGIGPSKGRHLVIDDQAGGYWSFGVDALYRKGILKPKQKLTGMLFNYLRKQKPDERPTDKQGRFLNKDGTVSKQQPAPFFLRLPVFRDEIDRQSARDRAAVDYGMIEAVRNGDIPLTKNPGEMNCPGCWAIDICELHEMGADFQSMIEGSTRKWNPYAEHEIYDGR
jgi:hypothetical protein